MLVNRMSSKFELRLIQIKFVFVDLIMVTVLKKDERVRDLLAGGSILLLAFSIPYSTALVNIFSALCLVCWLFSGFVRDDIKKIVSSFAGKLLIAFFALAMLSVIWSEAPKDYIFEGVAKLRKLLLVAVVWMLLSRLERFQKLTLFSLFLSFSLLALVCLGIYIGLPGFPEMTPGQGAIFLRSHIAQGYFLSLLTCICVGMVILGTEWKTKLIGLIFLILSLIVTFYMTNGRTGYACLVCVLFVLSFAAPGTITKKLLWLALAGGLIVTIIVSSDRFEKRWNDAAFDIQEMELGNRSTSIGYRLTAWRASIEMVKSSPLLGVGIGGWGAKFCQMQTDSAEEFDQCSREIKIGNPHSDYFNWIAQFGILGLCLWIAFLLAVVKRIVQFSSDYRVFLLAGLMSYMIGALFNSFIWDISEGTLSALMLGWILAITQGAQGGT